MRKHLLYNKNLKEAARELRKNMTPSETKLWKEFLRKFPYTVLRQKPIDNFIVDFYCAKLKLVIEIDGEQHYTKQGKKYDEERTLILESFGLTVIRFRNNEIMEEFEKVTEKINDFLEK